MYMKRRKSKYNWGDIQEFCNEKSRTMAEISKEFGLTVSAVHYAIKDGRLRSDSVIKIASGKFFNWDEIQKDFDKKMTWEDIRDKWGCSFGSITNAKTHGRIKTIGRSEAIKLGRKKKPISPSSATRKKISVSLKKFYLEHPEMVGYRMNHVSKGPSYPERYFAELFKNEGIELKSYYPFFTYELDFADPDLKIDIEVDGNQHRCDKKIIKHDIKRDAFLKKQGWRTFRIFWPSYVKLDFEQRKEFIADLKVRIYGPQKNEEPK